MSSKDKICQAYLEELQHLERFRASQSALYQDTPLEKDDPYTKRLIEALAFFGAKARVAGVERVSRMHQQLFRQYFPQLVAHLPACGMIQVQPSTRFPEKVVLPAGSEMFFKTTTHFKGAFQTLDPLVVFPLFQKEFRFERRKEGGWRCLLQYSSHHVSTEELGSFKLYIHHLSNFFSSLRLGFTMVRCLEKAQVFYDEALSKETEGLPCQMKFGFDASERSILYHEIEQLRSLLHMPEQELFLTFSIPPCHKRWHSLTLCLDFDERWPEFFAIHSESLLPFVVPIINLKTSAADPILCNGMKDYYPLLHPDSLGQFKLHTLLGVSEVLPGRTKAIPPGILGGGSDSYEVDYFHQTLQLDLEGVFQHPKLIHSLGLWSQPTFSQYTNRELELCFGEVTALGLNTRLLGSLHASEETIEEDPNFLIRILSLKNQHQLALNELLFIMQTMKTLRHSFFESMESSIREFCVHLKEDNPHQATSMQYEFFLKDLGSHRWEVAALFFTYVHRLLNSWLPHFDIETKVHFPQSKTPLILKKDKNYELSSLARHFFLSQ